jgi:hypothetical protein
LPLEQLGATGRYSDPQCTTPAMPIVDGCPVPAYVAVSAGAAGGCAALTWGAIGQTFSIYQVGAAQPDAGAGFDVGRGVCLPSSAPAGPLYAVSPVYEIEFAEGTQGQVTAGRYSMATVDFSDGAHYCGVYEGFYDSTLDVATYLDRSPDQTLHLFPYVAQASGFADSTCMTPATAVSSSTCASDARFALEFDDCSSGTTVSSVGAVLDAGFEQQWQPDGGYGCDPVAPDMMGTWHALGSLPQSDLGQVVRHPVGAGRLQYLTYEAEGQFRWRQSAVFDSQTGTPCGVDWIHGPATTRCLPTPGVAAESAFSDADCTQPLYVVYLSSSCAAPSTNAIASASDTCQRSRIVHVGPLYDGTVYEGSPGACFPVPPPSGGQVAYRGVDDIDPATYPELTAVVE